jgi:hypothetical protein
MITNAVGSKNKKTKTTSKIKTTMKGKQWYT